MSTELTLLAWCLVLAVVQVLLPSILRIQETGPEYNASPRDAPSPKPEGVITGRLRRAPAAGRRSASPTGSSGRSRYAAHRSRVRP